MNIQTSKYNQNRSTPINKAYYLSKSELLSWVSSILDLEITNFEQTKTGAVFCQLLDACHPGSVRMEKVNWRANSETDYISNFKIFQQGLNKNNIDKPIDINRLAKGKVNELIELLQWINGYYYSYKDNYQGIYNAKRRRGGENLVQNFKTKISRKNIRNNYSQSSNSSKNSFTTDINYQTNNYNTRSNNFRNKYINTKKSNQDIRNNDFINRFNNNFISNSQLENERIKNKSKRENKNPKYYNQILNNQIKENKDFSTLNQNKINNNINHNFNNNSFFNQNSNNYQNKESKYNNKTINKFNKNNNNTLNTIKLSKTEKYSSNNFNNNIIYQNNRNFQFEEELQKRNNNNLDDENDDDYDYYNENEIDFRDFFGLNEIETNKILEEEKKDGDKIQILKKIIRELRVSKIKKEKEINNINIALNNVNKLKNFYLNKLKDIEYLYFNPIIRNSNENRNTILRQILCTDKDSTIHIDENNYAFIPNKNNNELEKDTYKYHKYRSQPQTSTKNNKEDIRINNIENINNNNKTYINNNSNTKYYNSKQDYETNYINSMLDSFTDNNERLNYENEINIQNNNINCNKENNIRNVDNNINNINENIMNTPNFSNNNTNINFNNTETQTHRQIYNNSEFNYNDKIERKNHKILPIKLSKENQNQDNYQNNLIDNNNCQKQNDIQNMNSNNNFSQENTNNNLNSYRNAKEMQNENIQLNNQKILKSNLIENGNYEARNSLEKYNGENLNKNTFKDEKKNNICNDIYSLLLNDSLNMPGIK